MLSSNKGKRKRINEGSSNMHEGLSTEPKDRDTVTALAFVLSVVPAVARHLGLMNKAGVVDFELTEPSMLLYNWFLSFASNHLDFIFGTTQFSDLHRIMQGYLSRGVALSLIVTTTKHLRRLKTNYRRACRDILVDMSSAGMSLQLTHTAILSGLGRMVCPNLVWTNRIVGRMTCGDGGGTPVLDFEWLCAFLDPRTPVNTADPNYVKLKRFLMNLQMHGDYVLVPGLHELATYKRLEVYLEKYLSVVKESYDVYRRMIMEAASKRLKLSTLLGIEDVSLRRLCVRMNVSHDDASNPDPEQNTDETFLYLRMNKDKHDPIREVYVHLVGHLWLLALQGPYPLHSENAYQTAERLYAWVMRRFMPVQAVPAGIVFMDTFEGAKAAPRVCRTDLSYVDTARGVSVIDAGCHRGGRGASYIMRPIADPEVWDTQRVSSSPSFLPPYLPEDSLHMGALVQQYKLVAQEPIEAPFAPLTGLSARSQEIVPTRIYPLNDDGRKRNKKPEDDASGFGVVCICPNGFNFVLIQFDVIKVALPLEQWHQTCDRNHLGVGPLVHRPNAVVVLPCGLGVIQPRDGNPFEAMQFDQLGGWTEPFGVGRIPCDSLYFLDCDGNYSVVDAEGDEHLVHNRKLELLPVGKHLFVRASAIDNVDLDDDDTQWVKGWLRYPDECDEGVHDSDPLCIYVVFRVRAGGHRIVGAKIADCCLELPAGCASQAHI